ncbi:HAMP domain-containing protein [bacterium]|nr:HAMP domain-containing protein [bacterium]
MSLKFRDKLIGLVLIMLIIAGGAVFIAFRQIAENIEKDITERLSKSKTTYEEFTRTYFDQLILQVISASDNPKYVATLTTNDKQTIQYGLEEYNQNLSSDIFLAVSRSGEILGNIGYDGAKHSNIAQLPEVTGALVEGAASGGFWEVGDSLFWISAAPAHIGNDILGATILGRQINDNAAENIAKVTSSSIAFLVGGKIVAKDSANDRSALLDQLKEHRDALDQAMIRKESSTPFTFKLGPETFLAVASPVIASPGYEGEESKVIATYIFYSSLDKALEPLRAAIRTLAYIGIGGGVLALLIGFTIINGVTKPVRRLVDATHEIANGNLNFEIQVKTRDELGQLSMSFNEMTKGLKDKERVENLFGKYLSPDVAKKVLAEQTINGILKGERAKLSVMFTDIRGFTPMSRGMDPQELINLLNMHFDEMIDIIDRYGGTLDKFIGDAIMAFYGAPVHYEDFYMRAINAAVQMQRASEKFNFQRKLEGKDPIHVGIGINSGDVVVGNIGSNKRLEYTVIGETVNIANRLCSVAKKGQIIISQSTYDLLPNKSIASPIEQVMLKGVTEAVTVYEILWKS